MGNTVFIDGATTTYYVVQPNDTQINVSTVGGVVNLYFYNILNTGFPQSITVTDVGNYAIINNINVFAAGGDLIDGLPLYVINQNGVTTNFSTANQSNWITSSSNSGTSSATQLTFIAGEPITAPSVVIINNGLAYKYQLTNNISYDTKIGLAINSANIGSSVTVVMVGKANVVGSFVQNSVYFAGVNGILTTTAPTSGVSLQVGVAIDTDNLLVDFKNPVIVT